MSRVEFRIANCMARAPFDAAATTQKLEAVVTVPVAKYPLANHFWVVGAGHRGEEMKPEMLAALNRAADRIAVRTTGDSLQVVVDDGRYIADNFDLHANYDEQPQDEILAAQRATEIALRLAEGHQPRDLGLKEVTPT